MKRNDVYTLALAILQVMLFFRSLSLVTSGSALWLMKQNTTSSYVLIVGFIVFYFLLFQNISQLILTLQASKEEIKKILFSVSQKSVLLLVGYLVIVFITASQIN